MDAGSKRAGECLNRDVDNSAERECPNMDRAVNEPGGSKGADGRGGRQKGLDGNALKLIALVSMLTDHFGAVILFYMIDYTGELAFASPLMSRQWGTGIYYVYLGCRIVGRLAFPIYCFLLTEGFIHTHNRPKYCLRMAAFAVIAEIPFDLAVKNHLTWGAQNVFFELSVGLLTLWGIKKAEDWGGLTGRILAALSVVTGCIAAEAIRADYSSYGILLMAIYYLLRERKLPRLLAGSALAFLESLYMTLGAAALSFVPLYCYNGKRGKKNRKYLFYWFYPAHLLLLFALRRLALGIPL
ncbi:MAG: conjugal transfer protein TraX [Clostridium sp.]|nr:conjugal transfer protein TraX [Clostridium sp.]